MKKFPYSNDPSKSEGLPAQSEIAAQEDVVADASEAIDYIGRTILEHFWCPYCGGWHGAGPPPNMQHYEPEPASAVPQVLGKIVEKAVIREAETQPSRTKEPGTVNGEPVLLRRKTDTGHVDVYWGGEGRPDGKRHGHVVSNDGLNANYVREPGSDREVVVNDIWSDPYMNPTAPPQDDAGRYDFS